MHHLDVAILIADDHGHMTYTVGTAVTPLEEEKVTGLRILDIIRIDGETTRGARDLDAFERVDIADEARAVEGPLSDA